MSNSIKNEGGLDKSSPCNKSSPYNIKDPTAITQVLKV